MLLIKTNKSHCSLHTYLVKAIFVYNYIIIICTFKKSFYFLLLNQNCSLNVLTLFQVNL